MSQQIQIPAVSQTIGPELLALLWALKIDITGLADMPLSQAHEAIQERIERVCPATDDQILPLAA